jgi:phosphotransferase family enzyme
MPTTPLCDTIRAVLGDPLDAVLARSILGTDDADGIAERVEGFVRGRLGRGVTACVTFTQSVGAVFVLDLDDGSRIVLKSHVVGGERLRAPATLGELEAVYEAQELYASAGFPCARVLRAPSEWAPGRAVAAMTFLDAPRSDDPHSAPVRRAMAEGLARSVEIGRTLSAIAPAPPLPRVTLPRDSLFPPPHNALFDFGAPGAEWIDARARAARAVLDGTPEHPLVMHTDFSAANVRVSGGRIVAVYDMDSLACTDEMRSLASAAVHFSYLGDPPWTLPSRDEAAAFVDEYVSARGSSLDPPEKRRLDAAAIYALAYTARCEHGLRSENHFARDALRVVPDAYFG